MPVDFRHSVLQTDPYGPNAVNMGLGVADNLAKLRGMNAVNLERELLNQKTQATQPGAIGFENLKNRLGTQNMPQEALYALEASRLKNAESGSRLQNDAVGRKEGMARAGLYNAQAGAAEQKDILGFIRELQGVLNNSDPNSPEYQYANYQLGAILSDLGASPEQFGSSQNSHTSGTNSAPNGITQIPAVPGMGSSNGRMSMAPWAKNTGGINVNPFSVSSRSMRGAEGTKQNADGSYTYYSSPTTAAKTQNENRQAAESELNVLWNPVKEGYAPYQGGGIAPDFSLIADSLSSKFLGNKDAEKRLEKYALARMMTPEVANIAARMSSGGPVGVEAMRELRDAQIQNAPSWLANKFIPQTALNSAANNYKPLQSQAVDAAVNTGNSGYPVNSDTAPYYGQPGRRLSYTDLIKGVGAQPQAQQQAPAQTQTQSGWQGNAYKASDGRSYTREELEQIAKGGQ